MARLRSPDKRKALLQSAVREIAKSGLGVSTAVIAKGAGLAEGTMFRYFASKSDLLNELYLDLKAEASGVIESGFPHKASLRERARHIWTEYLLWAMQKPEERRVSVLLKLSSVISAETREQVNTGLEAVKQTMEELGDHGAFKGLPPEFASSSMVAMQEAVMEMAAKKPKHRADLIEQSFETFWRMAR